MIAAARDPIRTEDATQLAVLRENGARDWATLGRLTEFLRRDDVVVINTSATLPSSFAGRVARTGEEIEIRLAAFRGEDHADLSRWYAIAFGKGSWRLPTEWRGSAPRLEAGDTIGLQGAKWVVEAVDPRAPRLVSVRWEGSVRDLYRLGTPIQYSYMRKPIEVFDQQNVFSQIPISVEAPSACLQMSWALFTKIRECVGAVVPILHGAGISSSGERALDELLPLPEYTHLSAEAVSTIGEARARGSRIIAFGTTVFRALEAAESEGALRPGPRISALRIDANHGPRIVSGLLTGIHEGPSHHGALMQALQSGRALESLYEAAERRSFRSHEFGDLALVLKAAG